MAEQSLIPEKSSNNVINKKNEVLEVIKENLNYIYIVLMLIANGLLSILKIEDGTVGLNYPHTLLGWCLLAGQILAETLIGVLLINAFRRQGIKLGHKMIDDVYKKYLSLLTNQKQINPRSLKQYYKIQTLKDSLSKGIIFTLTSGLIVSCVISANLNNLLSLVVTTLLAIGFGIKTLLDAEEFVITELVIWYQLKIAEVTDQKMEPAKEIKENV